MSLGRRRCHRASPNICLWILSVVVLSHADVAFDSESNGTDGKAKNGTGTEGLPRFTWEGCLCLQRWQLVGYEVVDVTDYCANPDGDPGGDWCFIDDSCASRVNWGYCAPEPRCAPESSVLARDEDGQWRVAQLLSYSGSQVTLEWNGIGGSSVVAVSDVFTTTGASCLHTHQSAGSPGADGGEGEGDVGTTLVPASSVSEQPMPPFDGAEPDPSLPGQTPVFYPDLHGPALGLRLEWSYADVTAQITAFVRLVTHTVANAVRQPVEAVQVLQVMRGSVIVAVGVIPSDCMEDEGEPVDKATCEAATKTVRGLWLAALLDPSSAPRRLFAELDPTFPAVLGPTECDYLHLPCIWFPESDMPTITPCSGHGCGHSAEVVRQEPSIFFMILALFGFAGALPTFLCVCLCVCKVISACCARWNEHQHRLLKVEPEIIGLRRVQAVPEDDHVKEDWACSICLSDQVEGQELLLLPCKHTLHHECMVDWLQHRLSCPLCRTPIQLRLCVIYTTDHKVKNVSKVDSDSDDTADKEGCLEPHEHDKEDNADRPSSSRSVSWRVLLPNAVDDGEAEHFEAQVLQTV